MWAAPASAAETQQASLPAAARSGRPVTVHVTKAMPKPEELPPFMGGGEGYTYTVSTVPSTSVTGLSLMRFLRSPLESRA